MRITDQFIKGLALVCSVPGARQAVSDLWKARVPVNAIAPESTLIIRDDDTLGIGGLLNGMAEAMGDDRRIATTWDGEELIGFQIRQPKRDDPEEVEPAPISDGEVARQVNASQLTQLRAAVNLLLEVERNKFLSSSESQTLADALGVLQALEAPQGPNGELSADVRQQLGKLEQAVVASRGGAGCVLFWRGSALTSMLTEEGLSDLSDLGLDDAPDGITIWDGKGAWDPGGFEHPEDGTLVLEGSYRQLTEREWCAVRDGENPFTGEGVTGE